MSKRAARFLSLSRLTVWLALGFLAGTSSAARGAQGDFNARFDQANKLYEQAKYSEAAAAYETLVHERPNSPTLQFNLGNAHFKIGDLGRAIAAYRAALRSEPRDPAIRFNLAFARKQLVGQPPPERSVWAQAAGIFTPDEWILLTAVVYWLWMALLILRELNASLRRSLRAYSYLVGVLILLPLSGLIFSIYQQRTEQEAVIIASNASVHYGPLAESQTHFQLRDGAEVKILDQKKLDTETWYRIEDSTGRTGWVAELDLMRILDFRF
jgi:tetratricopeptide (TPR) repeat protein